jgi:hypothetical protein
MPVLASALGLSLLLALAGCTTAAPSTDEAPPATTDEGSTDEGSATTASCDDPGVPDDLKPFSSDLVTEPIPSGATYGDGSEIAFTTSLGEGLYPSYELLEFIEGVPTANTGGNWNDAGGGRYTNDLLVFGSELDGQPGLIEVTVIPDGVTFDGERYDGDTVILGIYCITYAVED